MRVSRAQAQANHERVIDVAGKLFRQHGFNGIGLNDLMKGAGLTQGGFYKQFASKEDLAAKACAHAFKAVQERWREFAGRDAKRPLVAFVRSYLSPGHRDEHAQGCVMAALGADAARGGPAVREAMEEGVKAYVDFIANALPDDIADRRGRSMAIASTMIGALVLSRSVNDETLSKDILDAAMRDIAERS